MAWSEALFGVTGLVSGGGRVANHKANAATAIPPPASAAVRMNFLLARLLARAAATGEGMTAGSG